MKSYVIKSIKLIMLTSLIILTLFPEYKVFAGKAADEDDSTINIDILNGNIEEHFNPNNGVKPGSAVDKITSPFIRIVTKIVNSILGILQVLGGLIAIISIAIQGFYMVVMGNGGLSRELNIGGGRGGTPEARQAVLELGRRMLIGAVLLFMSSTIVKFVFSIFIL